VEQAGKPVLEGRALLPTPQKNLLFVEQARKPVLEGRALLPTPQKNLLFVEQARKPVKRECCKILISTYSIIEVSFWQFVNLVLITYSPLNYNKFYEKVRFPN
jgi:hypothetical protein